MKKALITGINGFVGKYLTDLLLENDVEVHGTILSNETYEGTCKNIYNMDITNKDQVDKIISYLMPDYVYHLAGQSSVALSWTHPDLTIKTNVVGTLYLMDAIKKYVPSARILIVGSSDQYGVIKPEDCPIKETMYLSPQSPYATSKKAQEEIALQYYKAYDLNIILVRAFNHIGPMQRKGFVIADFASQIADIEKGITEPIIRVGNLEAKRDFTDVRDIVNAYLMLMEKGECGEIYNVGSGNSYAISDILNRLVELSKVEIEVQVDSNRLRPSDIPFIQSDCTKIFSITNWTAKNSLEKTLLDTLEYWRKINN